MKESSQVRPEVAVSAREKQQKARFSSNGYTVYNKRKEKVSEQ